MTALAPDMVLESRRRGGKTGSSGRQIRLRTRIPDPSGARWQATVIHHPDMPERVQSMCVLLESSLQDGWVIVEATS